MNKKVNTAREVTLVVLAALVFSGAVYGLGRFLEMLLVASPL